MGALLYQYTGKMWTAFLGEILGTGLLGGMLCYPVAALLLGNQKAALFTYVLPFSISTVGGCMMAAILLTVLSKSGAVHYLQGMIQET